MTLLLLILWLGNRAVIHVDRHFDSSFERLPEGLLAFQTRVLLRKLSAFHGRCSSATVIVEIVEQEFIISNNRIDAELPKKVIKNLVTLLTQRIDFLLGFLNELDSFLGLHSFSD
jgi:hypothetical protein